MGACGWVCEYALAVPADARSARHVAVERADHSEHDSKCEAALRVRKARRVRPRLFSPPPRWTRKRFPDSTGGDGFAGRNGRRRSDVLDSAFAAVPRKAAADRLERPAPPYEGASDTASCMRLLPPNVRSNCTSWATVGTRGGGHWRKRSGSIIDAIFTVGGRAMRQLPSCNRSTPSPSQASRTQPRVSSSRPWARAAHPLSCVLRFSGCASGECAILIPVESPAASARGFAAAITELFCEPRSTLKMSAAAIARSRNLSWQRLAPTSLSRTIGRSSRKLRKLFL